ncbi:MAG TPA: SRPBCC domain-containing protein [Candidatus Methylacidiphilales bacterium]|nr:SRPBCC domain-containing protein [Candidatus Methylacidiphilales bacterium]
MERKVNMQDFSDCLRQLTAGRLWNMSESADTETEGDLSEGMEILNARTFSVSQEVLFEAFSNFASVVQWWGPNVITNTNHEFDFQPGGKWRITMHAPNGANYKNVSDFVEVDKSTRVVHEQNFDRLAAFLPRDPILKRDSGLLAVAGSV